jgi:hypothetical protein
VLLTITSYCLSYTFLFFSPSVSNLIWSHFSRHDMLPFSSMSFFRSLFQMVYSLFYTFLSIPIARNVTMKRKDFCSTVIIGRLSLAAREMLILDCILGHSQPSVSDLSCIISLNTPSPQSSSSVRSLLSVHLCSIAAPSEMLYFLWPSLPSVLIFQYTSLL